MKTQDIRRGITSRHQSAAGEGKGIGRVSRVRDVNAPPGVMLRRRRSKGGMQARKKASLATSVLLGLATCGVIALAITLWLLPMLRRQGAAAPVALAKVKIASEFPSPSREEALDLVRRALAAQTPGEVNSLFRLGESQASEVLDYLKQAEERDGQAEDFEWLSSIDTDGLLMEGVLVVSRKREQKDVQRLAILTPDQGGSWKLDFAAYARLGSPSWSELLEKKPERAVVRVMVGPHVYYNGPFRDESEWVCYQLTSPDIDIPLRGYCKVGTPQAEALSKLFADGNQICRATLELRDVQDAESRQFEVTRLLASDWVVADGAKNGG
jgi:hypothetical protein